jgi:hypothetical protein
LPIAAPITAPKVPFRIEYTPRNNNLPVPLVGGDPTGTWRVTTAQIYIPESQRRNIDNDSRGEVTGWLKFEGNVVHGSVVGVMNLQTRIGDTPVNVDFDGGARILRQDPTMVMEWPCQNVDGGLPRETISYSVLTDRGYFVYKRTNTLGDFYIVLTATRV